MPTHPGATYRVRLTLAETWWTEPGKRVFDVTLNGAPKLAGLDVFALAGGQQFVPIAREFDFVAAGASSDIGFSAHRDNAAVAAIEVYELNVPRVMHTQPPAPPHRSLLQQQQQQQMHDAGAVGSSGGWLSHNQHHQDSPSGLSAAVAAAGLEEAMTYEEWDALDRLDPAAAAAAAAALTDGGDEDGDDKEIEPPSITGHDDGAAALHMGSRGSGRSGSSTTCLRSDGQPCIDTHHHHRGGAGASFARSSRMQQPVLAALIRDEQEHLAAVSSSSAGSGCMCNAAARLLAALLAAALLLLL